MIALFAKKKTGAVAARPVEEPLLVAAVHDARRGVAVSTASLARGGWCEDVSGLTNAQVLEQDQSRRGRWSAAFRSRQRGLRGSALPPQLVAVAVPVPMAVTVPVPVGRGSVLAPQPPSMRPQPSMTTGAPVVVKLNSFGRLAGRQADGMIVSDNQDRNSELSAASSCELERPCSNMPLSLPRRRRSSLVADEGAEDDGESALHSLELVESLCDAKRVHAALAAQQEATIASLTAELEQARADGKLAVSCLHLMSVSNYRF